MRKNIRNTQYDIRNTIMAWKLIKIRILGNSKVRDGSFSKRMLFTWCMLASVIMYLVPQDSSDKLQLAFAHIFHVPLNATRNFSLSSETQQNLKDTVPRKDYDILANENNVLNQQLKQMAENFQLLTDLNNYVGQNVDYIYGYIVPASANLQLSELTINCAGVKGLEKGQLVMSRNLTIIGTISNIAPEMKNAKVRLITDPDSKIPVRIEGLGQRLWMQGNGDNTAKIGNVSRDIEILPGQKVYALKHAGATDWDRYLGTVLKCKPDDKNPLLQDITVKPAWNIEELYEVAIIIEKQQ